MLVIYKEEQEEITIDKLIEEVKDNIANINTYNNRSIRKTQIFIKYLEFLEPVKEPLEVLNYNLLISSNISDRFYNCKDLEGLKKLLEENKERHLKNIRQIEETKIKDLYIKTRILFLLGNCLINCTRLLMVLEVLESYIERYLGSRETKKLEEGRKLFINVIRNLEEEEERNIKTIETEITRTEAKIETYIKINQ